MNEYEPDVFYWVCSFKQYLLQLTDRDVLIGPARVSDEEGQGYFQFGRGDKEYTLIIEEN